MTTHLITGATGFVGRHLVKSLLEKKGDRIFVLLRPENDKITEHKFQDIFSKAKNIKNNKLKVLEGDITHKKLGLSPKNLETLKGRNITLWHLAANLSFKEDEKKEIYKVNVKGTKNVIDFANEYAEKLIYVSTAYVSGKTSDLINEDSLILKPKLRNQYEETKYQAEKKVRAKSLVPFTIFRPSIIMGDAYSGKAQGCTFGYYRLAYVFYIFKEWIVEKIKNENIWSKILILLLGAKYNKKTDELYFSRLIIPFPEKSSVNMVSVDFVVSTMIEVVDNLKAQNKTFHLINLQPAEYLFLLKSLLSDLHIVNVKYIEIPNKFFSVLFNIFYLTIFPWRKYFHSARWYMPYIINSYNFSTKNTQSLKIKQAPSVTREYIKKVNQYAYTHIFKNIKID